MRRFMFYMFLIVMPIYTGVAGTVAEDIKSAWNYNSFETDNGSAEDFVNVGAGNAAVGGTGTNSSGDGVYDCSRDKENRTKSFGAVGVIARKIVAHGGYFCPTQVQCDSTNNANKQSNVWFSWYEPANKKSCFWLCDDGYAGTDCANKSSMFCSKDTFKGRDGFSVGLSIQSNENKTNNKKGVKDANKCKSANKIDSEIQLFDTKNSPAKGVVLGVVKFLDHGVVAAPIKLECANRKDSKAWLNTITRADGDKRVLCADGYHPSNGDCVAINQTVCEKDIKEFCSGFASDKYDASQHSIEAKGTECLFYLCSDNKKSFTSATDTTCVDCAKDARTGVDTKTGLCKTCKTGEYFSSSANDCADAATYTKDELKFGIGSKSKEFPITSQCWPKVATDYTSCVGKKN